ncbi:Hsp20 family protein [Halobaculum sp. WSA2]|uniref:Hsp20 family protein n=1 Tax=Halobaculum saliterrae TaxID=2073113 RepID=A0A6B0T1M5_9EURY|nr:Hsp20/alpha crystallin family protein [Halobaculum saliterrae]MXR42532.1 Hsp20 family protein [Halobaculum saliterrae]
MTERTPFDDVTDLLEQLGEELDEVDTTLGNPGRGDVPVDLLERDGEFVVVADLPGFGDEDVEVTVSGRTLTLRAESDDEETSAGAAPDGQYHRRERRRRSVTRRVQLPDEVNESEATATYDHGVLTVTLPKREPDSGDGTQIDVE